MNQNYKVILKFLYDEFGDDLIDRGRTAIEDKLEKGKSESTSFDTARRGAKSPMSEPSEKSEEKCASEETKQSACEPSEKISEAFNYGDADVFERQFSEEMQCDLTAVMNSADVADAVKNLIFMAGEVRKFEEAQITVRADISARRDVALANIELQKTALMEYLDKSFDERKDNFNKLFSVVDDALEKDNMQELAMGLEGIIKLADSSPFKDLQTVEATAAALTDPNHEWSF